MNTIDSLEKFGLTSHESRVYTTLLSLGEGTAYAIAKKSGMKRPTVYGVLEVLREKELVLLVPNAKKQVYAPKDPQKLVDETVRNAQQQIDEAHDLLPKLLALNRGSQKPNVLYFDGKEGVQQAFEYSDKKIIEEGSLVGLYAYSPEEAHWKYKDLVHASYRHIGEKGVMLRGIIPHGKGGTDLKKFIDDHGLPWEVRFLPLEKYSSKISIEVAGDLTRIISRHGSKVLLIENVDIAETLTQVFELVWTC